MRKKVIQIGIGHDHALDVLDSMLAMPEVFEVVAMAVPEAEKEAFSDKLRICTEKMKLTPITVEEALSLPGICGAVIETEELLLCHYAMLAAQKGFHIHMDKPGCADSKEFEGLVDFLEEKHLVFSMGYMYRYNPEIQKVFALAEQGKLGDIYSVEAQMNCEHSLEKRKWLSRFPGGMMFFLGCHLVDLIYRLQGMPERVIPLNTSVGAAPEAEDFGMAVLEYPNGASMVKVCDAEPGGFMRRQLVVCGTKGTVEIRPIERWLSDNIFTYNGCTDRNNMASGVRRIFECGNWGADCEFAESLSFNRYDGMMEQFAKRIDGMPEPVYTYDYERKLFRLLMQACEKE